MIQMSPPPQEYSIGEYNNQDFDFLNELGVTLTDDYMSQISGIKKRYQEVKNRLGTMLSDRQENKSEAYARIDYNNIKQDGYTVQSITEIENKIIISSYKKNHYSRLYIYDIKNSELEGIIILDNKDHVGGITFDYDRNILYITGNNWKINSYDYNAIRNLFSKNNNIIDLSNNKEKTSVIIENNLCINTIDSKLELSTIYYYNNRLYIATFNPISKGYLYSYQVDYNQENKTISVIDKEPKVHRIGARTQGIAITNYNGKDYLVCSHSIGIACSSLLVYELSDDINFIGRTYIKDYGLEGITIDDENNVIGIFEHNNIPIFVINFEELLKEVSNSFLDIIPGIELESLIGGIVYKLLK